VDLAIEWETATVCCRPADLPLVVSRLRRTVVGPTTVIAFPRRAHVHIKEREALVAVDQGAVELDVVLNIGALRSAISVRARRAGRARLRGRPDAGEVILETAYLTPSRSRRLSRGRRGPSRVRQERTGYSPRGAEAGEIGSCAGSSATASGSRLRAASRTLDAMLAMLAPARAVSEPPHGRIGYGVRARGPERSRPFSRPLPPRTRRRAVRQRRGVGVGADTEEASVRASRLL